ncbi:hypothetical protein, partial [Enterovibrio baiacu]|uniref:hypothetical protein n=1 Tax=Enterovibrio baiacu TaxID=2491023 RepID=UPI003D0B3D4E
AESDETVSVTVSTTSDLVTDKSDTASGTIEDDRATGNPDVDEDVRPNVTITGDSTVTEADGVYLTYTAKLDGPAADDITASLTLGGNATQGSDYGNLQVKINGEWKDYTDSITLPKDGSAVELRVPVKDDKLAESDETVSVTVSTTSDLVTDKSDTASGTIEDDRATGNPDVDEDVRPNVTITGDSTVTEADGVYLTYTAKLDGPAADDITASLTLGGNATQGSDYGNLQV